MKKIVVVDCVFLSRRPNRLLFLCVVSWRLIRVCEWRLGNHSLSCECMSSFFFIFVEMVSFLYAILMNTGSVQSPTPTLPEVTISLTTEALCTLNFMATVDLSVLQVSGTQTRSV